jgi:peptidylprolyl isomerase
MKAKIVRPLFLFALLVPITGCTKVADLGKKMTPSGARYVDIKEGEGTPAQFGDVVFFSYVGKLADGVEFERRDKKEPAAVRLGWRYPIIGLDEGLEGIKVGGIRTVWVPANIGYGTRGSVPRVPPNADLVFENIEVVRIATKEDTAKEEKEKEQKAAEEAKKVADKPKKEESIIPPGKDIPESERKEVLLPHGLKFVDVRVGDGRTARNGNKLVLLYVGRLANGTVFEVSRDPANPFAFVLGSGRVIRGWDEGLLGMKAGGRRTIYIPPELGYGSAGAGAKIPPNSSLVFDIELLRVF